MNYYKVIFLTDTQTSEILTAFLAHQPFDVFEPTDDGMNAYLPEKEDDPSIYEAIETLKERFSFTWTREFIPYQNWNSIWESNFEPMSVDNFCGVRASFHPPFENVKHEIVIDPKMAFGTGHHETTYMVMQLMEEMDFEEKEVFDFGCGTGILAILAEFLGAKSVLAVDYDPLSTENSKENIDINKAKKIEVGLGELDSVERDNWDIILANINRNVLLNSLDTLYSKLKDGGQIVISGFLQKDKNITLEKAKEAGFKVLKTVQRNDWVSFMFER